MWCIPEVNAQYIEKMIDVLEVYERPCDSRFPVVCFDEKTKQLLDDVKDSIQVKPGKIKKVDCNYRRKGIVNLFVATEPKGKTRYVTVTKHRKKVDFAKEIEKLTMKKYKEAEKLVLITDNLNIHSKKAILETLGEEKGKKVTDRIEWHYTPRHASWLNMAEIEINVLSNQCLKRKISSFQKMQRQVAIWKNDRNKKKVGINWQFTREKAEKKFKINGRILSEN